MVHFLAYIWNLDFGVDAFFVYLESNNQMFQPNVLSELIVKLKAGYGAPIS